MDSERTEQRRRLGSPWTVVAVVAVLTAGGGGAYWASAYAGGGSTPGSSDGNGKGSDDPPPPLNLTGGSATAGGRLTAAVPLPSGPDSAPVRGPQAVPRAAVEKLAKALGVPGTVRSDAGVWKAGGTANGGGPVLQVNSQAPGVWSYSLNGSSTRPLSGDPLSAKEALVKAAPVLKSLGLDGGGAQRDASRTAGALRAVTVDPVVDGLPTHGWSTDLQLGPDGRVITGYGRLSPLSRSADYPVVGAKQALKTLNGKATGSGDYGIGQCPTVVPKESKSPGDDPTLPHVLPCIPGKSQPMTVRSARFGLSSQFVDGRQALVPSWLFEVAQTGVRGTYVMAQQAVDPAYVRRGGGSSGGGSTSPAPSGSPTAGIHKMRIESYTASDTTLTVRFWGGVCNTYSASADESGSQVLVRVTGVEKNPGRVCVMLAKEFTETVRLDKPLGGRKVVDAWDGRTVPAKAGSSAG